MTDTRKVKAPGGKGARAKTRGCASKPFTCSIQGPGVDIAIRLDEGQTVQDLFQSIANVVVHGGQALRQGYVIGQAVEREQSQGQRQEQRQEQASGSTPFLGEPLRANDPTLRAAVTSDLREMWNAMWPTRPHAQGDQGAQEDQGRDVRDTAFERWVAGTAGQRIIDEALGKFDVFPGDEIEAQGDQGDQKN